MAGGGIGEAMLLGAAMGGGSSALRGGDILQGALLGGITGGIGGAVSPLISNALGNTAGLEAATQVAGSGFPIPQTLSEATISTGIDMLPASGASAGFSTGANEAAGLMAAQSSGSAPTSFLQDVWGGVKNAAMNPVETFKKTNPLVLGASGIAGAMASKPGIDALEEERNKYKGPLSQFRFRPEMWRTSWMSDGGITSLASGGYDRVVGQESDYQPLASGGISQLGHYSDGGRMLRGPGDGMSDSIPASIGNRRPARLADGEFVVPADVVSHLGNGSTDAGARQLYAMMAKVRKARTGRKAQGREIKARKFMPQAA